MRLTSSALSERVSFLVPVEVLAAERHETELRLSEQDLLAAGELVRCHDRLLVDVNEVPPLPGQDVEAGVAPVERDRRVVLARDFAVAEIERDVLGGRAADAVVAVADVDRGTTPRPLDDGEPSDDRIGDREI